jgi:glycosyltransferase involved in cell wall biosynthesis
MIPNVIYYKKILMPKVSIITTTYKHPDFIAQTIESVISQIFPDWELLI